ncbi:MAG: hypothetical protein HY088_01260 [Ignavibacteriales bacterium]|nr:hypothetical protein [Ignavibacteriales bacterium]
MRHCEAFFAEACPPIPFFGIPYNLPAAGMAGQAGNPFFSDLPRYTGQVGLLRRPSPIKNIGTGRDSSQ